MLQLTEYSLSRETARHCWDIPLGSAFGELSHGLKRDAGGFLDAVLLVNTPRPVVSRIQWMQRSSNLAWLAGAFILGVGAGLHELGQSHIGWAAGWWLLMPLVVICLAFSGLQRLFPGEGCLTSARSLPVIVVITEQPVDFRKHLIGVLPRARDSIP